MNVYVSGSIHDIPHVHDVQRRVRAAGHYITHDWTAWDRQDEAAEAERQLHGVWDADVLLLVEHPKGRAAKMEFGAAVSHSTPCLVIPSEPRPSLWYSLPWVCTITEDDIETALEEYA